MHEIITASGRGSGFVTNSITVFSLASKGCIVISAALSIYSVATAPHWEQEAAHQVLSWSGAIAGGELGAGVGAILGPVGAILGGIAGSFLGALGADKLATWFFGGSSRHSAVELLDQALNPTSEYVAKKLANSGTGCYTHYVRAVHMSVLSSYNLAQAGSILEEMVNDVPSKTSATKSTAGTNANGEVCTLILFLPLSAVLAELYVLIQMSC